MSFLSLLTLLFIGLKLTDYIDWSWWLVLLPTIIHAGLFILAIAAGLSAFIWKTK
jgi:hypothetical protein